GEYGMNRKEIDPTTTKTEPKLPVTARIAANHNQAGLKLAVPPRRIAANHNQGGLRLPREWRQHTLAVDGVEQTTGRLQQLALAAGTGDESAPAQPGGGCIQLAQGLVERAAQLEERGDHDEAAQVARRILDLSPGPEVASIRLAAWAVLGDA